MTLRLKRTLFGMAALGLSAMAASAEAPPQAMPMVATLEIQTPKLPDPKEPPKIDPKKDDKKPDAKTDKPKEEKREPKDLRRGKALIRSDESRLTTPLVGASRRGKRAHCCCRQRSCSPRVSRLPSSRASY